MTGRSRLLLLAAAAAAALLAHLLGAADSLTLASLRANREALAAWRSAHPAGAVLLFVAAYVVQTALALPGAAVLSLAAGALFGTAWGTLWAVTGATLGACASFLATRLLLRDAVLARFGAALAPMNRELAARGLPYLLFLRLVPVFPFFLVNLAAALSAIPFRTFLLGTAAGIVPGGLAYVHAGSRLASLRSPADALSPPVLAALALLGALALAPALYRRLAARPPAPRPGTGDNGTNPRAKEEP